MTRNQLWMLVVACLLVFCFTTTYVQAQVTIAQISDSHIGLARSPQGSDQLRKVVQMVNQHNPDAVVVSGDIGERPAAWDEARGILQGLKAKVYYVPGNHDVHSNDVDRYRQTFGNDYYKFSVKNVTIYAIDSQLLGNWDEYDAKQEPAMPQGTRSEADKMMQWLEGQGPSGTPGEGKDRHEGKDKHKDKGKDKREKGDDHGHEAVPSSGNIVLAMQHVPAERDHGFPKDSRPYWVVNDPYRSREEAALKKLGVKHILAGHWHDGRVFDAGGFTWHIAPSTSWSPFEGKLGFALHTISPDGQVRTQFFYLDGSSN